jgi:hypothetical protein
MSVQRLIFADTAPRLVFGDGAPRLIFDIEQAIAFGIFDRTFDLTFG